MRNIPLRFVMPTLLPFLIITAAFAGGWAIVTIDELPDYAVSGRPISLTFTVRQHGITPLAGLKPNVRASASGHPDVTSSAAPTGKSGTYTATMTFRQAGAWTIRIDSGFNANETRLLPLTVIDAGSPPPAPLSPASRGEHLFVAKGCIGCHRHQQIAVETRAATGLDLTARRFPAGRLREFLADPSKALKRSGALEYGQMPNLGLEMPELDALVAFINKD